MLDAGNEKARAIAQTALEETGAALISGDFDLFSRHYETPYTIATETGIARRATDDELRDGFYDAVEYYRARGVTRLDRQVESALFDGPDGLRYCYVTQLMAGDQPYRAPYPNIATLRRRGDRWLTIATEHIVSDPETFSSALLRVGHQTEAEQVAARAQFQSVLDQATRAYLTGDFDLLADVIRLPLFLQGSKARQVFATRAALEADFRHYMREFTVNEITDIVRLVKSAVKAGADRMHGSYRTHILCGTRLFVPSYVSAMTMERKPGGPWQISTIMHPAGHWTRGAPDSGEVTS